MIVAALTAAVFLLAALVTDTIIASVVAGVFSVVNTVLLSQLGRKHEHTSREVRRLNRVLAAPRRLVYDEQGRPFGTVLALQEDDHDTADFHAATVVGVGRRRGDQE